MLPEIQIHIHDITIMQCIATYILYTVYFGSINKAVSSEVWLYDILKGLQHVR